MKSKGRICSTFLKNMDLKKTVKASWRQEAIIKSLVWNSVIEVFQEKKDIDITEYLSSIQIKEKMILIKTNKSIMKSEMIMLDNFIQEKIEDKFKKVGIKFYQMELKYL